MNVMLYHEEPLDSGAKSKALISRWIISYGLQDGRVDHAAAQHFKPTGFVYRRTDVDFQTWFHERKIAGPESKLDVGTDKSLQGNREDALQMSERDVFIDHQSFELMKHRRMSRIHIILAEHPSRTDDPDVRRVWVLEHEADLTRGRVRAQERILLPRERGAIAKARTS